MRRSVYTESLVMASACAAVGVLAALGKFNAMMNFPVVFALICLGFGLLSIWRQKPRRALASRALILLIGAAVAVGGWEYQKRQIDRRLADRRTQVLDELRGTAVPSLAGLEPLNTDRASWDQAASLGSRATVITFWARWCSPCEKEMPELEELYRRHKAQGLQVVAVTQYDRPENAEERQGDFEKAQRFLARRQLTYPAAITDRGDVYSDYRVYSLPATALVDGEGRVVDYAFSLGSARELMQAAAAMVTKASTG